MLRDIGSVSLLWNRVSVLRENCVPFFPLRREVFIMVGGLKRALKVRLGERRARAHEKYRGTRLVFTLRRRVRGFLAFSFVFSCLFSWARSRWTF